MEKRYPSLELGLRLSPIYPQGAFLPHPVNFSNIYLWLKILLAHSLLKQEEEIWQDITLAAGLDKVGLQEATCLDKSSNVSSFHQNIHRHICSPNISFTVQLLEASDRVSQELRWYLSSDFFFIELYQSSLDRAAWALMSAWGLQSPATYAASTSSAITEHTLHVVLCQSWKPCLEPCTKPASCTSNGRERTGLVLLILREACILETRYFRKPAHEGGR